MLKAIRLLRADQHDVALYGLITGPFTLALHLKGTKIFTICLIIQGKLKNSGICTNVAKSMAAMAIECRM